MISTRVFQALFARSATTAAPLTAMQSRTFMATKKRGKKTDASASEFETEEPAAAEPEHVQAAPVK